MPVHRILSRLAANAASNLSMFATCPTTDHDNITQGTERERICCKRTGKAPPRYRQLADRLTEKGPSQCGAFLLFNATVNIDGALILGTSATY
jgi:hypothetical protein